MSGADEPVQGAPADGGHGPSNPLEAPADMNPEHVAFMERLVGPLKAEIVELRAKFTGVEAELQETKAKLQEKDQQVESLTGQLKEAKEQLEEERKKANRRKVVVKNVPGTVSNAEVAKRVLEVAGQPASGSASAPVVVETYTSGRVRVLVLGTWQHALVVLKAARLLGAHPATRGWRLDRCYTKQEREKRTALWPLFQQLREAGARPRYHGTELYVKMTTGIKPAAEWDPAKKLPEGNTYGPRPQ